MAHVKSFDQLVDLVPVPWRTDAVVERLRGVDPIVFETDHRPRVENLFAALRFFDPKDTKVIILGQDPYTQPGKAHGLAFGVAGSAEYRLGETVDSLSNIYKAVRGQTGGEVSDLTLEPWAQQGVLLLNRILTVGSVPLSHANHGWEAVTQQIILEAAKAKPVGMLWGAYANSAAVPLREAGCRVLSCSHPSPLSAHISFFSCRQFEKTQHLIKWGA